MKPNGAQVRGCLTFAVPISFLLVMLLVSLFQLHAATEPGDAYTVSERGRIIACG